ncbi:hypothetical protein GCM10027297_18430 [Parahaliea aestuarii]
MLKASFEDLWDQGKVRDRAVIDVIQSQQVNDAGGSARAAAQVGQLLAQAKASGDRS